MLNWIVEGIRWIVWGLTGACLHLMDICYDLVVKVASADFLSSSEVWGWYYIFMTFLGVIIMVRMISVFIKVSFDEDYRDKVHPSALINKFFGIAFAIILIPFVLTFISKVSVWGINNISMVVSTQSDKPSTFVITSFMNTDNGKYNQSGQWVSGTKVTYTLADVDINKKGDKDDYQFFPQIQDLFIVTIIGIAASIMLLINGIQIGKRMYAIVLKVLIAPLPISAMIVPGDESFGMWQKMIISDYLLNYFQTLMIIIVMILSGSKVIQGAGVWAQILSFIAGLLLLLSGIPELARLIGGDTSQASVLQQIASFRLATRGVGSGISHIADHVGAVAGLGAAAAMNVGGRMMGGESIKNMAKDQGNSNGFLGGNQVDENNQTSYSSNQNNSQNNQEMHNQNVNGDVHENDQNRMNQSSQNSDHSSLFNGNESESFGNGAGTSGNAGSVGGNSNFDGGYQGQQDTEHHVHSSREGTTARRFSDHANEMNGALGFGARFASNATSHMYQASQAKLQNSRIYRISSATKNLGKKRIEPTTKQDTGGNQHVDL